MSDTPAQSASGASGGYKRLLPIGRATRKSVLIADKTANSVITVGGLLVILAVFGILLFLAKEALPLFMGGTVKERESYALTAMDDLILTGADEYQTVALRISSTGRVDAFHIDSGRQLASVTLDFDGDVATAVGATISREDMAFGFADGSVRFARVALEAQVLRAESMPAGLTRLSDTDFTDGTVVYRRIAGNQVRRISLVTGVKAPQQIAAEGVAIKAISFALGGTVERPTLSYVTFDAEGVGRLTRAETRINLMTRQETVTTRSTTLPALPTGTRVAKVLLSTQADQVYVGVADGTVFRFDTRDFNNPVLAETAKLTPEGVDLGVLGVLIGNQTIVVGGSDGSLRMYFRLQPEDAGTADGFKMVLARELEKQPAGIVAYDVSQRRKSLVTLDSAGNLWFRHATSEQTLLKLEQSQTSPGQGMFALLMPRDDGAVVMNPAGLVDHWRFYVPHPETTLKAIFGKKWYEGYSEPTYTWQSSSGTDLFEPKFSLVPLIFGTLKATVYSLMFAIPIALLAAIYTSEFVHRGVRATVKPVMEMMESLPTVVLGFIAALILAPIVESWISAVMLGFIALPLGLMAAAYAWQMLPPHVALKLNGIPKFALMFAVILVSAWLAYQLGPWFEQALFYGDFKAWTNHDVGTGTPFMGLFLWPLWFVLVAMAFNRSVGTRYRMHLRGLSRPAAGRIDAARWVTMAVVSGVVSFAAAGLLTTMGFDPRGGVVDTYVQRNALVVGMVMGFAIIPNIYTLAEDALNSVPSQLRAASLAAGATPWQTAIWVVLPTAMSGVFAAVMIGMGRAVGETMIVVMAAGNTPVLDWNIFNGLRTLSANIAVELPEAVLGGTLYRMLFLAALVLFMMTFVINTCAEIIRQRFRKRAFQL
ncbi:MAG: ABC transporter permease subunit [Rhodocyclaceae bacterium]